MRVLNKLLIIVAFLTLTGQSAFAHPVAYKGAFALMSWNQPFLSDHWLAYSFRPDMAVVARGMRMKMDGGEEAIAYLPQFDYLVKRWNSMDHQANIYVFGGFGGLRFQERNGSAGIGGIEADAESRRLFVLGKYEAMLGSLGQNLHKGELRLGIAPYEAEYEEIASWFMVMGQYHPALEKNYAITPLVRFFYKSVLWETGISLQGDWMLNLMFHF